MAPRREMTVQDNRRWISRRVYRERVARRFRLKCDRAPTAWNHGDSCWQLHRENSSDFYPFVLVSEHRKGLSVTVVFAGERMTGGKYDPKDREYLADSVRTFADACRLARPKLRVYEAASRLTGAVASEIEL